ncbi:uncharacterized protein LOC144158977 [Haemaphysalis longicornis]
MDDSGEAANAGDAGELFPEAMNENMNPVAAELQHCRGYFTGASVTDPWLCTLTESEPCHIVRELSVWNEFFSLVRLELKEESPGKFALFPLDNRGIEPDNEHQTHVAFTLVHCLLKDHRCISTAQFPPWDLSPKYEKLIASGLRACQLLKALRLGRYKPLIADITPAIPFLTGLEEFECGLTESLPGFIEAVCSLITKPSCLGTLSLMNWKTSDTEARLLWGALSENNTLTSLAINSRCLRPGTTEYSRELADYLENNGTLNTLRISACMDGRLDELVLVVNALRRNKTLVNVSLQSFFVDNDAATAIKLYLTENSTVQKFNLEHCLWYEEASGLLYPKYEIEGLDTEPDRIHPWISLLRKNRSLRELRLKLVGFSQVQCMAFFAELAQNCTLDNVIIEDLHRYCLFRSRSAPSLPVDEVLSRCEQLHGIHVSVPEQRDVVWFNAALGALGSFTHLMMLKLEFRFLYNEDTASALREYITQTSVLRDLVLDFRKAVVAINVEASKWQMSVFQALQQNTSVRKLVVKTGSLTDEEADVLSDLLRSSKAIHDFHIDAPADTVELLGNRLSPNFSDNFTLASLGFRVRKMYLTQEWFAVKDVVRRNSGLVTRAAYFVSGKDHSRQCVEALEHVALNPALRERVCALASVSEQEAGQMVRESLKSLQSLDDFFRAAEVVKDGVVCYPSEDGTMQLTDLPEYAWLCLREYLKVSDVVHTSVTR